MSVKRYEWVACDEHSCHCDVVESVDGDMVDYEDYAALEQKLAESQREFRAADATIENLQMQLNAEREAKLALAAENAGLKSAHPQPFGPVMMKALDAYEKHQDDFPETGMLDAFFILRDSIRVDLTATDAILAEVRNEAGALAVELFAQTLGSPYSVRDEKCYEDGFTRAIEVVRDIQAPRFAFKIRQAGM